LGKFAPIVTGGTPRQFFIKNINRFLLAITGVFFPKGNLAILSIFTLLSPVKAQPCGQNAAFSPPGTRQIHGESVLSLRQSPIHPLYFWIFF
jgi:hypothetical protein